MYTFLKKRIQYVWLTEDQSHMQKPVSEMYRHHWPSVTSVLEGEFPGQKVISTQFSREFYLKVFPLNCAALKMNFNRD